MRKRNKNHASHTTGAAIAAGTQIEVAVTLKCADANQSYLCGDFNRWSSDGIEQGFDSSGDGKAVRAIPVGNPSPQPLSL